MSWQIVVLSSSIFSSDGTGTIYHRYMEAALVEISWFRPLSGLSEWKSHSPVLMLNELLCSVYMWILFNVSTAHVLETR